MFLYRLLQAILFFPLKIVFPTIVKGKKNLVKGGAVIVCNHQSYLDAPLLATSIFKHQTFMAKKQLFKKPILKSVLKGVGAISVDREKTELSTIKNALKVLGKDKYLTIFPQGTRVVGGKMENVKAGAILLSVKSGKPIVPIWIQKKARPFVLNKMVVGKAIYPQVQATQKEEIYEHIESQILKFYKELEKK